MSQRTSHTHCQSPTSQRLDQSFAKECACPTPKEKLKFSSPSENKKYPNPQADTKPKNNLTMLRKLNIDNGLRGQKTERQLVTGGIFYCRVSAGLSVSASNKLSCNLTGQCFEIGNKNIPPNR
jgi:hypothetical protein